MRSIRVPLELTVRLVDDAADVAMLGFFLFSKRTKRRSLASVPRKLAQDGPPMCWYAAEELFATQSIEQVPERISSRLGLVKAFVMLGILQWVASVELRTHANQATVMKILQLDQSRRKHANESK
jgi:hypothetical protein